MCVILFVDFDVPRQVTRTQEKTFLGNGMALAQSSRIVTDFVHCLRVEVEAGCCTIKASTLNVTNLECFQFLWKLKSLN